MKSLDPVRLSNTRLGPGMVWLLSEIAELKGKHAAALEYGASKTLDLLATSAIIQSTESSNRIEGIVTSSDRLRPLLLGTLKPQNRSEEELLGYRNALSWLHHAAATTRMTENVICKMHGMSMHGAGDADQYKCVDNDIVELRPGLPPRLRFYTVCVAETPEQMNGLVLAYEAATQQNLHDPLVVLALTVFDFLCIHPFRDGNGRVSRLLTTFGLHRVGHGFCRFVPIERKIEETKDLYYDALQKSSVGWHEGQHDIEPWLQYFLSTIRRAYLQLDEQLKISNTHQSTKSSLIYAAIKNIQGPFTVREIASKCPSVSHSLVRSVLKKGQGAGWLTCTGRGPGARWEVIGDGAEGA